MVKSYRNLKVGQYIELQSIDKDLQRIDRIVLTASIVTGKPVDHFDNMNMDEIPTFPFLESGKMPFKVKKTLFLNGKIYRANIKVKDFPPSVWGAIMHYRTDTIENLHNILAWIYKPVFTSWKKYDTEKAAHDFYNHANMADVYGCFFLFFRLSRKWKATMEFSINQSREILMAHLKEMEADSSLLTNITDGTIHSNG